MGVVLNFMAELSSISIHFFNELQDHLEAQRIFYKENIFSKLDKVVALLLLVFGTYYVVIAGIHWWTVVWFPLAVGEWFDLFSLSRLRTRIGFKHNPKFQEEYHLTFSPEAIHFKTETIDSVLKWTHYQRVLESPKLFLLIYGKGLYTLVPKRCLRSQEEIEAFRALLQKMIPSKTIAR